MLFSIVTETEQNVNLSPHIIFDRKQTESKGIPFGGFIMERINHSIGCNVNACKYNADGMNCTLSSIHIGQCCTQDHCTRCDSYEEK